MERKRLISKIAGTAFGLALLIGTGMISGTTAQAQGRGHWGGGRVSGRAWSGHIERRNDFRGSFDRRGFDRSFFGRERFIAPRSRVFIAPRFYSYPRYYPYYPYGGFVGTYNYYGSGNYYGSENGGYRDGYDRGREDARDGRGYNPNNSSHFRDSLSAAYRDGFRRGYDEGYRQYAGYRW